jgi:hypothetical protein
MAAGSYSQLQYGPAEVHTAGLASKELSLRRVNGRMTPSSQFLLLSVVPHLRIIES